MKWIAALAIAVLVVVFFVFMTHEQRYECAGEYSTSEGKHPAKVFIKLVMYRWWVKLWSDSDGHLFLEIPSRRPGYDYYAVVKKGGELLHINERRDGTGWHGTLSRISDELTIQLSPYGNLFKGSCRSID